MMDYTENEAFKIRYTITILQRCLLGNDFFYFSTIFYQFSKRYACVLLKKEIELNFPFLLLTLSSWFCLWIYLSFCLHCKLLLLLYVFAACLYFIVVRFGVLFGFLTAARIISRSVEKICRTRELLIVRQAKRSMEESKQRKKKLTDIIWMKEKQMGKQENG